MRQFTIMLVALLLAAISLASWSYGTHAATAAVLPQQLHIVDRGNIVALSRKVWEPSTSSSLGALLRSAYEVGQCVSNDWRHCNCMLDCAKRLARSCAWTRNKANNSSLWNTTGGVQFPSAHSSAIGLWYAMRRSS